MARSYSVAVASLAIGAAAKWTDNLIAHHSIPEVPSRQRGVARGIPWSGLVRIAIVRELHQRLGCGVREAVRWADALMLSSSVELEVGAELSLRLDREALELRLRRRLEDALETAPRPRRGRPPQLRSRAQ